MGEESSERYAFTPAQLVMIEDVCKKYACDGMVKTAIKPPQPTEKSYGRRKSGASDRGQERGSSASRFMLTTTSETLGPAKASVLRRVTTTTFLHKCSPPSEQ
jgi:hypothetical protein